MRSNRNIGLIQLALVCIFIIGSITLSYVLKSVYEPPLKNKEENYREPIVQVMSVDPRDFEITFTVSGVVEALTEVDIVPEVSGRIVYVDNSFRSSQGFTKETVLFRLDAKPFELNLEQRNAALVRSEVNLQLELAQSKLALSEWTEFQGDNPIPDLVARKPQLAASQAELNANKAVLERAKLDLKRTAFHFPFNGKVIQSDIALGQYVVAGRSYGKVFNLDNLEVKASLEDHQLTWILGGVSEVSIRVQYLGKMRNYAGKLKRTASALDASTRFTTAYFSIESNDEVPLIPGVFSTLEVKAKRLEGVLVLPITSLVTNDSVWLLHDDKLQKWKPDIIQKTEELVAVRSESNQSVVVVVGEVPGAFNGMQVSPVQKKAKIASDTVQ